MDLDKNDSKSADFHTRIEIKLAETIEIRRNNLRMGKAEYLEYLVNADSFNGEKREGISPQNLEELRKLSEYTGLSMDILVPHLKKLFHDTENKVQFLQAKEEIKEDGKKVTHELSRKDFDYQEDARIRRDTQKAQEEDRKRQENLRVKFLFEYAHTLPMKERREFFEKMIPSLTDQNFLKIEGENIPALIDNSNNDSKKQKQIFIDNDYVMAEVDEKNFPISNSSITYVECKMGFHTKDKRNCHCLDIRSCQILIDESRERNKI